MNCQFYNIRFTKISINKLFMKKLIVLIPLLFYIALAISQPCREVVGYYPAWQFYDRDQLVNPATIDYSKYTTIVYAFFNPQPDGSIIAHDQGLERKLLGGEEGYPSLVENAHKNGVKVLASIGGWTLSSNFPQLASDAFTRMKFAEACVALVEKYDLDGIDIDWEYPGYKAHNGREADTKNFTLMISDIRFKLDSYGVKVGRPMTLSIAAGSADRYLAKIEWEKIRDIVDMVNLMSYNYSGSWDTIVNHHTGLYYAGKGDPTYNVDFSVQKIIEYGIPAEKINLGLAFYARSLKTHGKAEHGSRCRGYGDNETFEADAGSPPYYNLVAKLDDFTYNWDDRAKVPFLLGKGDLWTFVGFDDERSIEAKARYAIEKNLGGAVIWELTGDYIETQPGSRVIGNTPLVNKVNSIFCMYKKPDSGPKVDEAEKFTIAPSGTSSIELSFKEDFDNGLLTILSPEGNLMFEGTVFGGTQIWVNRESWTVGKYLFKLDIKGFTHTYEYFSKG